MGHSCWIPEQKNIFSNLIWHYYTRVEDSSLNCCLRFETWRQMKTWDALSRLIGYSTFNINTLVGEDVWVNLCADHSFQSTVWFTCQEENNVYVNKDNLQFFEMDYGQIRYWTVRSHIGPYTVCSPKMNKAVKTANTNEKHS